MGVVSSSSSFGVIAHDVLSGRLLWVKREFVNVRKMFWDRKTASLFCVLNDGNFVCIGLDGTVLRGKEPMEEGKKNTIRCSELVMPGECE